MSYLIKDLWERHFKGWHITDVAIRESDVVYFCLRKNIPHEQASMMWDHDIECKNFGLSISSPIGNKFGATMFSGFNKPRLGVCRKPLRQGLLAARNNDGQVNVVGGGSSGCLRIHRPRKNPEYLAY